MKEYRIISDGSCDLPVEVIKEQGITVVPFYVSFDQVNYKKEIEEVGIRDFYQEMVDRPGCYPKSSLPAVQDYVNAFTPLAEAGIGIICICITSKFSGSVQSANNAKEIVLEEYPDAAITVIDARINTVLQGLYVLEAAKLCNAGVPYKECVERILDIRDTGRIFFTVGSIDYLQHGGRIGKVAGAAVSVLGIKPMITLKEGEIFSSGIARGRKRSRDKAIELLKKYIEETGADRNTYRFCIGYGYDVEEGNTFREEALKVFGPMGFTAEDFPTYQIGATIAVHTGPYPIGFGVIKKA